MSQKRITAKLSAQHTSKNGAGFSHLSQRSMEIATQCGAHISQIFALNSALRTQLEKLPLSTHISLAMPLN